MNKHEKIKEILKAGIEYKLLDNNTFCFINSDMTAEKTAGEGLLGQIQHRLKNLGSIYSFIVRVFSPVVGTKVRKKTLNRLLADYNDEHVILNIGSGPAVLKKRNDIINIDLFAFDHVDVLSDATSLPFEDHTVDLILNIAMMEHLKNPELVLQEMHRILKPEGKLFAYVPFIVPYHAAPDDYYRWTQSGIKELFSSFQALNVSMGGGPTSGFLWVFQEWLSTLLSFGNRKLHDILLIFFMLALFPLKYVDFVLNHYRSSANIASGFFIVATKDILEKHYGKQA